MIIALIWNYVGGTNKHLGPVEYVVKTECFIEYLVTSNSELRWSCNLDMMLSRVSHASSLSNPTVFSTKSSTNQQFFASPSSYSAHVQLPSLILAPACYIPKEPDGRVKYSLSR